MAAGPAPAPGPLVGVARPAAGATAMPHDNGIAARAGPRSDDAAHGACLAVMRVTGSTLRRRSMSLHREAVALRFAASDARGAYGGGAGSGSHSGLALAGGARIHCALAGFDPAGRGRMTRRVHLTWLRYRIGHTSWSSAPASSGH